MAQSSRDIQRRMQTVKNTGQITKAMEMIAAAKLRKAQNRVEQTRPYREQLETSLGRVLQAGLREGEELPALAQPRDGDRPCLLVITSDRGLAGGYNANVIRKAEEYKRTHPNTQMVLIGRKARDHFRRRNEAFLADYVYLGDDPRIGQAQDISATVQEFYINGLFDRLDVLYTRFFSTIRHQVTIDQVLPLKAPAREQQRGVEPLYWYEPSVRGVLESMVPLYIDTLIFQALLEAVASEQGARMTAMRSASDNAAELLEELNLSYNRVRQGMITTEIAEIVGGSEALG